MKGKSFYYLFFFPPEGVSSCCFHTSLVELHFGDVTHSKSQPQKYQNTIYLQKSHFKEDFSFSSVWLKKNKQQLKHLVLVLDVGG